MRRESIKDPEMEQVTTLSWEEAPVEWADGDQQLEEVGFARIPYQLETQKFGP